ncbi:MAG: 4Fe-4S binding protein [Deferribacteraceae bacterium]|jgi:ferredoxin|nr:4Fe-4S binding protein [Deferribacteraceae bacterium]
MFGKFNLANSVLVGMSQAVGVRPERCNKMCHKLSKCNLCETNCPTGAIKVGDVGSTVNIDWDSCTYCGICVNICPTGVFNIREMEYENFLKEYLGKITPEGELKLSCKVSKSDAAMMECLGIIGLPDLLYLYTHGASKIIIETPDCTACASKYGRDIVTDEIEELKKLSTYFEYLDGVQITHEQSSITIKFPKQFPISAPDPKEEKALKMAQTVDRRGMFGFFRDNAADTLVKSAALLTPQELPTRTTARTTKEVPAKRKLLIESLLSCGKLLKDEIRIGAYFYNFEIATDCVLCKVCTRMCPTGAFHMSEDDKQILFNPSNCTSCGMCRISCYYGYIVPSKTLNLKELFDDLLKFEK